MSVRLPKDKHTLNELREIHNLLQRQKKTLDQREADFQGRCLQMIKQAEKEALVTYKLCEQRLYKSLEASMQESRQAFENLKAEKQVVDQNLVELSQTFDSERNAFQQRIADLEASGQAQERQILHLQEQLEALDLKRRADLCSLQTSVSKAASVADQGHTSHQEYRRNLALLGISLMKTELSDAAAGHVFEMAALIGEDRPWQDLEGCTSVEDELAMFFTNYVQRLLPIGQPHRRNPIGASESLYPLNRYTTQVREFLQAYIQGEKHLYVCQRFRLSRVSILLTLWLISDDRQSIQDDILRALEYGTKPILIGVRILVYALCRLPQSETTFCAAVLQSHIFQGVEVDLEFQESTLKKLLTHSGFFTINTIRKLSEDLVESLVHVFTSSCLESPCASLIFCILVHLTKFEGGLRMLSPHLFVLQRKASLDYARLPKFMSENFRRILRDVEHHRN